MPGLSDLHEHVRTHGGCGFEICESATHLVPGEGSETADVMIVGEAPGKSEDEQGRPFVGRSGKFLDELLAEAGLDRGSVYITNVVKARPPDNRDPTKAEVEHWMPVLEEQLALVAPRLVVPLGRHALAHFAPDAKISQVHGTLMIERDRALYPMYHPAAALRGRALRQTAIEDARGLPEALKSLPAP